MYQFRLKTSDFNLPTCPVRKANHFGLMLDYVTGENLADIGIVLLPMQQELKISIENFAKIRCAAAAHVMLSGHIQNSGKGRSRNDVWKPCSARRSRIQENWVCLSNGFSEFDEMATIYRNRSQFCLVAKGRPVKSAGFVVH